MSFIFKMREIDMQEKKKEQEAQLKIYIQKLQTLALQNIQQRDITPLEAIREAFNFIEGEMLER